MPLNLSLNALDIDAHFQFTNRLEIDPVSFAVFTAPKVYQIGGVDVAETDYFTNGTGLPGVYNPDNHTSAGIVWLSGGNYAVNIVPAAFAGLESGFTGVYDATVIGSGAGSFAGFTAADTDTFSPFFDTAIHSFPFTTSCSDNNTAITLPQIDSGVRHRFAFNYASGVLAISVDGGEVLLPPDPSETFATSIDEIVLQIGGDTGNIIHHLALYPLQNNSALPILSAL